MILPPTGTGNFVLKQMQVQPRLHLLSRDKKQGLGKAYLAGFAWALQNGFRRIVEMDADFSHRPEDLPSFCSV